MITAVDVNAVESERQHMGDNSALSAIHFGFKERVLNLILLCIRRIGKVFWYCCRSVLTGKSHVCHVGQVPSLPVRPRQGNSKRSMKLKHIALKQASPNVLSLAGDL